MSRCYLLIQLQTLLQQAVHENQITTPRITIQTAGIFGSSLALLTTEVQDSADAGSTAKAFSSGELDWLLTQCYVNSTFSTAI